MKLWVPKLWVSFIYKYNIYIYIYMVFITEGFFEVAIYIYVCIYICVCMYIYIYIYITGFKLKLWKSNKICNIWNQEHNAPSLLSLPWQIMHTVKLCLVCLRLYHYGFHKTYSFSRNYNKCPSPWGAANPFWWYI